MADTQVGDDGPPPGDDDAPAMDVREETDEEEEDGVPHRGGSERQSVGGSGLSDQATPSRDSSGKPSKSSRDSVGGDDGPDAQALNDARHSTKSNRLSVVEAGGEVIQTDLEIINKENARMRSRLQQLESDLLQARVHSDRITAENERLSMRLSEAVKERDELKARTEQDRATLALLTARLKESEERIVSFNQLLDQAIEPFRSKLKLADDRIAKLTKENETLKTKKMQLLDKALDLKLKLKHIGGEGALPKPTPLSPDVSAYGGKYRRLPSIGAAAAQDENRLG